MTDNANYSRNAPCPCGSGKRYKHCCGDVARDPSGAPQGAMSPATRSTAKTKRTYVVLGSPRGGTSLLAGALHRAGVYMGEFKTKQYEDPDFKIPPNLAPSAALQLGPTIRSRNEQFEHWGWKLPNNIYYIRQLVPLLIDPLFLFIYRDPQEIARSSARHDARDWNEQGKHLLDVAISHTQRVRAFQDSLRSGFHAFQLETIHANPAAFVAQFCELLAPLEPDRDELLRFVHGDGGYH